MCLDRIKCSCYTPLEALIILVLDIHYCFLPLKIIWEFDVRAAVQQSDFSNMDVKIHNSSEYPVASSLMKILNSFVKCVHGNIEYL